MDFDPVPDLSKKCYKIDEHILFDSVFLYQNKSNANLLLWNKYQILLFENFNLSSKSPITFIPDFFIAQLMALDDLLVCLDCSGNLHTISLNLKNTAQKRYKSGFQQREVGVAGLVLYEKELLLTLKIVNFSYYLCLYRVTQDFHISHEVKINFESNHRKSHEKCILKLLHVPQERQLDLQHIFDKENLNMNSYNNSFIVMSLDAMTVYGCLLNTKLPLEEANPIHLYSCPSKIYDIQIQSKQEIYVLIAMQMGTLIRLALRDTVVHEVFHLNGYIHHMQTYENSLVHTDGKGIWLTENIFQHDCVKQKKINVKMVNSFIVNGNHIFCVTFSNVIYNFSLDDDKMYTCAGNEYYSADRVLKNAKDNFKEIERGMKYSKDIAREADIESNYLLAMALSKRQDLMSNAIQYVALILESIDATSTESNISLTSDIHEYFKPDNVNILIRVLLKQHKFNVIFSHLLQDLKLHVTLFTGGVLLKTVSIAIKKITEELSFLIPLTICFPKIITIKLNLVPTLPGPFDENQRMWVVLSSKVIVLNCEHFIKSEKNIKNIVHLKKHVHNVNNALSQLARNLYKSLLDFEVKETSYNQVSFYLKLPQNYKDILISEESYGKTMDKNKVHFIAKKFSSLNFSPSKVEICFDVLEEKVQLEIIREDFVGNTLKISCADENISLGMRHFFSSIVYGEYQNIPDAVWVPQAQYAMIEDLQRNLRNVSDKNGKGLNSIIDQFNRNVIAALPL